MSTQTISSTFPLAQTYLVLLVKSATGKMEKVDIPIPEGQTPEDFMKAVANVYETHTNKAKRIFYRCVLCKKAVVSTATLFKIANSGLGAAPGHHLLIKEYVRDHTLTSALREPAMLSGVDPDSFFEKYRDIIVDTDHINTPSAAILIHLEDDLVAAKTFGILCSGISLAAGLTARIVS